MGHSMDWCKGTNTAHSPIFHGKIEGFRFRFSIFSLNANPLSHCAIGRPWETEVLFDQFESQKMALAELGAVRRGRLISNKGRLFSKPGQLGFNYMAVSESRVYSQ